MKKRVRLTETEKSNVVMAYETNLVPMIDLAEKYNITRQGIYKILTKAGINTHKGEGGACRVTFNCFVCQKPGVVHRGYFKKHKHHFCSEPCYFAWLKHGNGNPLVIHRHSARMARAIISNNFLLSPGQIVHHEDRNQYNNDLRNLKVFANQGDHVRYHRGIEVPILWP